MKKTIKLNERDLTRIVKRVVKEQEESTDMESRSDDTYSDLVDKLNYLLDQLDDLSDEFEDIGENRLAETIYRFTNKITGYL